MNLELSKDEALAMYMVVCMRYAELPRHTRRIMDLILLQMRHKEPSLLRSKINYRPREPDEEHSG